MGLMGWNTAWLNNQYEGPEYEVAVSFAGNVFSAFALAPMFIALLCAAGMPQVIESADDSDADSEKFLYG